MNDKCQLTEPPFHQCCCVCKYHVADHHHCSTSIELRTEKGSCVCGERKGWVCLGFADHGRVHSNWPEHSVGCELWTDTRKGPNQP